MKPKSPNLNLQNRRTDSFYGFKIRKNELLVGKRFNSIPDHKTRDFLDDVKPDFHFLS